MYRNVLGKVTMSTKEYRSIMNEIADLKVAKTEASVSEFQEYKRAEKAESKIEYLTRFIHSDASINDKFREYEIKNEEAKN